MTMCNQMITGMKLLLVGASVSAVLGTPDVNGGIIQAKNDENKTTVIQADAKEDTARLRLTPLIDLNEPKSIISIFPDRTLANRIVEKLGKSNAEALVSQAELDSVEEIVYSGRGVAQISNLEGIQYLRRLTVLGLEGHNITAVHPLNQVTTLRSVDLSWNKITDIEPLSHLTNLEELNLRLNKLTDVRPLRTLTQLRSLTLDNTGIADLTGFESLRNLEFLNLRFNAISDVTPILHLTKLKDLNLEWNRLLDLRQFKQATLPNLVTLNIKSQKYTEPLARPHEETFAVENNIRDVEGQLIVPTAIIPNSQREPARYEAPNVIWQLVMSARERPVSYTWQAKVDVAGVLTEYSGQYIVSVYGHYPFIFVADDEEYMRLDVRSNTLVEPPVPPQKTGYRFIGWYTDQVAGDEWDFAQDHAPTRTLTLYARWEAMDVRLSADNIIIGKRAFLQLQRKGALADRIIALAKPRVLYEDDTVLYDTTNSHFIVRNLSTLMHIGGYGEYTIELAHGTSALIDESSLTTEIKLIVGIDEPGDNNNPDKEERPNGRPRLPQTGIRVREQLLFGVVLSISAITLGVRSLVGEKNRRKS